MNTNLSTASPMQMTNCFQNQPNAVLSSENGEQPNEKPQPITLRKTANESAVYAPRWLRGGAKHPGLIVETPGLANVVPPPIIYRPHLPADLCGGELLSQFQFERVIYAGQAHAQRLPESGARAGISIGDGTGTGKTSTLAGIIPDNWFQRRSRTVWFSVKADLIEAVRE